MMKIKFRAWDKHDERFREIKDLLTVGGTIYGVRYADMEDKKGYVEIDRVRLMQCTGVKDKNGKEIYEGDVVRGDWGSFRIREAGLSTSWASKYKNSEVIGNIYDNTALKKEER